MNTKLDIVTIAAILLILLFLWIHTASAGAQNQARADLKDSASKNIGSAVLTERGNGVLITVDVKGLPQGLHAVHVHAVGKCEGPAFTSAGGHFNPQNKKRGFKNPDGPHAGDLPYMYVNKDGVGRYEVLVENIALGGQTSVFDADGSAIVVHATADDNVTDPAGNSGDSIACGVITRAATKGM
jgi:superoxide dismutase, Cu-Zn family